MASSDAPILLTVEEAAGLLRISPATLYRMVSTGSAPCEARRIGNRIMFSTREVLEFAGVES